MEVYAPFYGSVSSSPAINIPQHYTANGTKPSESKAKRGKRMKTIFRKLKKTSQKKKKDLTENKLHDSVSRTSSFGSCSSCSSGTDTSRTEETTTSSFNASHGCATSYGKEEPAKRMSNGNRKQDANSGDHEGRDEWKKQSKSQNQKDGQKVYPKRQRLDSSIQEETQRNRVGRIKGIWKKIRKSKKKNKISESGNLQHIYVEYEEIKGIMTTNCEKLLKRNDKIEDLEDRGEKLVKQCEVFSRHAKQIRIEHASWWTRMCDALRRLCCCFGCCRRAEQ